jgi:hypothetical protein
LTLAISPLSFRLLTHFSSRYKMEPSEQAADKKEQVEAGDKKLYLDDVTGEMVSKK